jgi:predicted TIM-barrel fold metal-dependent hydrolase
MRQFTSFMFSEILSRLPRIRLAFLEAGCGWVPYLISKMEPRMKGIQKPSALIAQERVYFQCGEELTTSRDLELLGDRCLFWASDFPHEGILNMKSAVEEFLSRDDISPESKRRIGSENPKRLYGTSQG